MKAKRITHTALLTAVALAVSVLEHSLPPLFSFAPGVKLGLSNAVCLFAVFFIGVPDSVLILLFKCAFAALFAGNPAALLYSVPAGLLSLAAEILLIKKLFPKITVTGISMAGSVLFNAAQLAVAALITGVNLLYLLPVFMAVSTFTGLFTGLTVYYTLKFLPNHVYLSNR